MTKQSGFTITELLVAISVGSIASVLMVTAFVFTYGSVIVEQTRTSMTRESQVFLRRMVEDIRIGSEIRQNNSIADPSGDSWATSDPANTMVITSPATDDADDLIYTDSGFPYLNEVVYFSENNTMYRRMLRNDLAVTSTQTTTCRVVTSVCPADTELVRNVENMLFEFYDSSNNQTTIPEEARSVQVTINLRKKVYGNDIRTTNTTRITLRNEQ